MRCCAHIRADNARLAAQETPRSSQQRVQPTGPPGDSAIATCPATPKGQSGTGGVASPSLAGPHPTIGPVAPLLTRRGGGIAPPTQGRRPGAVASAGRLLLRQLAAWLGPVDQDRAHPWSLPGDVEFSIPN